MAPTSPCPNCGRVTKTVDGVCAECWAAKEPGARPPRRGRTEPLLDLDWNDPRTYLSLALVAGAIGVLFAKLLGWI